MGIGENMIGQQEQRVEQLVGMGKLALSF